jgi:leucyl/phenylalanyl-tRNA---protein transferase
VGGVYGIALGACFCAESMFHRKTDASKVALWALVDRCRDLGFTMFDAQIMNPHLASLGAYEIAHRSYMARLRVAAGQDTPWGPAAR